MTSARPMAAGGSLAPHANVTSDNAMPLGRRLRLLLELAVIFVGAPLAISYAVFEYRWPLFIVLQPVLLMLVVYLLWDKTFLMRRELAGAIPWRHVGAILATFLVVGGAVTYATYHLLPNRFLSFPRYLPKLWMMVMVVYPLASVIAQELVYRTFFFHRYGALFGHRVWLAIVVNAALFGFGHIIFGNWVAIAGTTALGALLAYRYVATRSFWAVWLEHSLYGWLVFTVGLGRYFFTGVATFN